MELTLENMFTEKSYEVKELILGDALGLIDRKRMLSHVMADITHRILSAPGSNPVGLTVTVQLVPGVLPDGAPDLLVTATCPQYDLDSKFFSS